MVEIFANCGPIAACKDYLLPLLILLFLGESFFMESYFSLVFHEHNYAQFV